MPWERVHRAIMADGVDIVDFSAPPLPLILHIEDDEGDAKMVARSLARAKCRARIARVVDGREALVKVESIANGSDPLPDLVLLDLKLPYASGIEVLQKIRSFAALSKLPIVVLTSSDVEDDRRMCMEYGCTEYAVKPIDYFAFLATLKDLCERYILPLENSECAS